MAALPLPVVLVSGGPISGIGARPTSNSSTSTGSTSATILTNLHNVVRKKIRRYQNKKFLYFCYRYCNQNIFFISVTVTLKWIYSTRNENISVTGTVNPFKKLIQKMTQNNLKLIQLVYLVPITSYSCIIIVTIIEHFHLPYSV